MRRSRLDRLDSFPYRNRLKSVMTSPVVMVPPDIKLGEATHMMDEHDISSVLVRGESNGLAIGIITERDVLQAVARDGATALDRPIADYMLGPVESLPASAMVYQAIGRMDRLGIRHLAVSDDLGHMVGIVTARHLLRQRAGRAPALGDQIAVSDDARTLGAVRTALVELAQELRESSVPPLDVAAVVSSVMRTMTARAAELAKDAMAKAGRGDLPAPACLLILGSGGRAESLLAPDQDNALIHAGSDEDDAWFAELGERLTGLLDEAGVPFCKGGVMASRPAWRHHSDGWDRQIDQWIRSPTPDHLLSVDIFFDFQPVWGDRRLARKLRERALERAAGSTPFLKMLSLELDRYRPPLGLFGGFQTVDDRVDLKLGGLFPIVAGARTLALCHRIGHTSTPERLAALAEADAVSKADVDQLIDAHQHLIGLILDQQISDIRDGATPGNRVTVDRLNRTERRRLQETLRRLDTIPAMVKDALAG